MVIAATDSMRPTSVTGLILSNTSSLLGTVGTDFYIKVRNATLQHSTPIADVTGDGDQSPRYLVSYFITADWLIRGNAVAAQAIGIMNMGNSSKNPTSQSQKVKFMIGNSRSIVGIFFIHQIAIEWDRSSPFVGLSMALRSTNVNTTGDASLAEST